MDYLKAAGRRRSMIPEGFITLANSLSAFEYWNDFTLADGRQIIGAGGTYSVGATGGTQYAAVVQAANMDGAHTGDSINFITLGGATLVPYGRKSVGGGGSVSAGLHYHQLTCNYERAFQQLKLIIATRNLSVFPADSIVLTGGNVMPVSGLSRVHEVNKLFKAANSLDAGGGAYSSAACSDDNLIDGHDHENNMGDYYDNSGALSGWTYSPESGIHHQHGFTPTVNEETLKATFLAAWAGSSAFYGSNGIIGMWQGSTPPPTFALANGENGTVNLVDYFLKLGDETEAGNSYNVANKVFTDFSVDNAANIHGHTAELITNAKYLTSGYHHTYTNTHNHTVDTNETTHAPSYYALTFIQKMEF